MHKVNISIDDVSPHPQSSIKVLDRCFELIDIFPDIKFTLFIPSAYWRTKSQSTESPLWLSRFPDFCEKIRDLSLHNFEVGYHGYYHGIPHHSNNSEFLYLSEEEALAKFALMIEEAKKAGLEKAFQPIFRPPAFKLTSGTITAAKKMGIKILALHPAMRYQEIYKKDTQGLKTVFATANPPFDPLDIKGETEIVYHACEWDKNYLSAAFTEQLKVELEKYKGIKFCFMNELLRP
jgi:predicted deacetylase